MGLIVVSVKLPGQMVPLISRGRRAGDAGVDPAMPGSVPNVPRVRAFDVALRAEDKFIHAVGLVDVELQRLGHARVGEVKVHVILEVSYAVVAAQLLPPQGIGVRRAAADGELHGSAAQGRRIYALL